MRAATKTEPSGHGKRLGGTSAIVDKRPALRAAQVNPGAFRGPSVVGNQA